MARLLGGEDAEFVGIFDVHHLIANVVGSFYQKDEGVTGKSLMLAVAL